jgi:hypothetical protein
MPAERRGAAALDRYHDLELTEAHMAGVGLPPRRAMAAEDIRDLQRRARHERRASGGRLVLGPILLGLILLGHQRSKTIQRARHLAERVGGDLGVVLSSLACPSNTWMMRISTPRSSRWVAKL